MGQLQAKTNNNITPNKTLVTSPSKKKNLHTVATRPLAINGCSEESKHNMERPAETEFSDIPRPTAGKRKLLS
jgi:hypothetical protein